MEDRTNRDREKVNIDYDRLYDDLIAGIPEDAPVDDLICTHYTAVVVSRGGMGLGEFMDEFDTRPMTEPGNKKNLTLRQLAEGIKSWNMTEAAIGQAAINAYYNSKEMAQENGIFLTDSLHSEDRTADPFITYQKAVREKKVTVVGHFPYLSELFEPVCDLSIIEAYPEAGDYPDQAAEYLIPGSDFVFLGPLTLIDKSLPRLLQLAEGAFIGMVGPASVLSPVLFRYGVDEMDGFVIKDNDIAYRLLKEQESLKIYSSGQKVSLRKTEYEMFRAGKQRRDGPRNAETAR